MSACPVVKGLRFAAPTTDADMQAKCAKQPEGEGTIALSK